MNVSNSIIFAAVFIMTSSVSFASSFEHTASGTTITTARELHPNLKTHPLSDFEKEQKGQAPARVTQSRANGVQKSIVIGLASVSPLLLGAPAVISGGALGFLAGSTSLGVPVTLTLLLIAPPILTALCIAAGSSLLFGEMHARLVIGTALGQAAGGFSGFALGTLVAYFALSSPEKNNGLNEVPTTLSAMIIGGGIGGILGEMVGAGVGAALALNLLEE